METSIETIEMEAMVLVRHLTLATAGRGSRSLDRSAYTILSCLNCGGAMSIGELSDIIGLEQSTLTRQTSSMLKVGLVERIPDPDGGIARKYRATEVGRQRLVEECRANMRTIAEAATGWSAEDLEVFAGYLERFNVGIEGLEDRHWPRPLKSPAATAVTIHES